MEKIEIGHRFECPVGHKTIAVIGGYLLTEKDDNLFIIGNKIVNVTSSKIEEACVIPLHSKSFSEEMMEEVEKEEGSLANVFNLRDVGIHYLVRYGDNSYLFKNSDEAFMFMNVVVGYKADALVNKYGKYNK